MTTFFAFNRKVFHKINYSFVDQTIKTISRFKTLIIIRIMYYKYCMFVCILYILTALL